MSPAATPRIVVMGVSGSGKSTIGPLLAARLGLAFADADPVHPPGNESKMAAGVPLTDADRWPWLAAISAWLAARGRDGGVVACSALRRSYRDRLREGAGPPAPRFVHLTGPLEVIVARQAARRYHFMPSSLLPSQFAALEPPGSDEGAVTVSVDQPPETVVEAIVAALAAAGAREVGGRRRRV